MAEEEANVERRVANVSGFKIDHHRTASRQKNVLRTEIRQNETL